MYNKQLDTFLAVAKLGSFSKAAEALYITPSAVIQQINNLERDLQVSLLHRTKKGAKLTRAGEYLFQEGQALIRFSTDIRRQLNILAGKEASEVCVGTTLLMKCRLFYDLWHQFKKENPDYDVKIVAVGTGAGDIQQVDIVEGIKDDEWWQKDMNFLELCTTPIACAVPKGHELASRNVVTMDDLKGRTLVTIAKGMSETLDRLQEEVIEKGVYVKEVRSYNDVSLFSMCVVNGYLLQTPLFWKDIHPDLVTIPCEWDYSLPYGLHYKKNPSRPVRKFLDFVKHPEITC